MSISTQVLTQEKRNGCGQGEKRKKGNEGKKDLALASKGTEHDEHLVRAQLPLAPAMPTLLYLLLYLLLY